MKKKLRKEDIRIHMCKDGKRVCAALFENEGWLDWEIYALSDLPNNLVSLDDLKRFGINIFNV